MEFEASYLDSKIHYNSLDDLDRSSRIVKFTNSHSEKHKIFFQEYLCI